MNDTFDYFEISQIDNFVKENVLKINKTNLSKAENISLDDSLFLKDFSSLLDSNKESIEENVVFTEIDSQLLDDVYNEPDKKHLSSEINKLSKSISTQNIINTQLNTESLGISVGSYIQDAEFQLAPNTSLKHNELIINNSVQHSFLCGDEKQLCLVDTQDSPHFCKQDDPHLLSSWGLPEMVLQSYARRNITSMFDWQLDCLNKSDVIENNKNLVYSAPTSSGKTLVSEILALKCLFERNKKVIFILPFISVVREKMYYFQDILNSSGKRVEGFMGSYNPPGGFQSVHMAIGTIEKCNSLVNRLLEESKLEDIGLVIIDEMHLIGDPSRGYLLELLLTKLKYIMLKNANVKIQIVGMSATLPNLELIANWLDAELYTTTFRPIPLHEMVYVCGELYNNNFKLLRKLASLPELTADSDDILQLCLETIEQSCSVLIFCPTKNWCENLAQQIAMAFWRIGKSDSKLSQILRKNLSIEKITEIIEQLKYCPSGLDKILKNTVSFGVAFHHAGLTMEERDIIEGGFKNGGIRLLIATSTLSSGVNLPARRVIIRSPIFGGKSIDILTYRQMIGRAGRMGIDTEGQSILICQKSDHNVAKTLTQSSLKPVQSCLEDVSKFKRAILEIIASGVASTPNDLNDFEKSTLISIQNPESSADPVTQVVEFLKNFNFIRLQTLEDGSSKYFSTELGKACLSSSLPPGEGLELFTELEKARQCLVLETELHLIYLVTPYSACHQWSNIDWLFYLELWAKLPLYMKKVGELVGVRESFIVNATRGKISDSTKLLAHKRFFVALALQDLVNEKGLEEVASKFSCNRGMLQSLQQSASTFAGMVTSFSRQLGWSCIEILISQFQDRLQFGINRDLLDLMKLPCLNGKQARALYNAGVETLTHLANSDVDTIENILHKVVPFENMNEREGETEHEFKQRYNLRNIWITGKQGLTEREAAAVILVDARKYLENELGVTDIKWGNMEGDNSQESSLSTETPLNTKNIKKSKLIAQKVKRNLNCEPNANSTPINKECDSGNETNNYINYNKENIVHNNNLKENKMSENNKNSKCLKNDIILKQQTNTSLTNKFILKPVNSTKCLIKEKFDSTPKKSNSSYVTCEKSVESQSDNDLFEESLEDTINKVSSLSVTNKRNLNSPENIKLKKQKIIHDRTKFELNLDTIYKEETSVSTDLSKIHIIEVCKHKDLYRSFCDELMSEPRIALSLEWNDVCENVPTIGVNSKRNEKRHHKYEFEGRRIQGLVITWDGKNAFYLYLESDDCEEKLKVLRNYFEEETHCVKMFNAKDYVVMLNKALNLNICTKIEDPKVFDWMLEPDGKEKNLQSMISKYCPEAKGLSLLIGNEPKIKAVVESIVTWTLMAVMKNLTECPRDLFKTYEIEMLSVLYAAKMEVTGIGIDMSRMEHLLSLIKNNANEVEKKIYSLSGRKFSLTSSKEIIKLLKIQPARKKKPIKQMLEESTNPIAALIILWRKLSGILGKMLLPLIAKVKENRIYGKYITHTSTGRFSMHEPNIQNIAKDFEFQNPVNKKNIVISCRNVFVPRTENVFLSADYCQLELRMLALLSKDKILRDILHQNGDIFKSIAAKWNHISEDRVTDVLRTQTKQICYGIIYGIGSTALAHELKIHVDEAALFMENFKNTYPGINVYIKTVIDNCKDKGYIETLSGRRRNLPLISDDNAAIRSHAERQAVNSTIQGSAVDLVKQGMKNVDKNLSDHFRTSEKPILVLHLHDELLFEVRKEYLQETAKLLKISMESCLDLSVPFPVKLKWGYSWGSLSEYCDI